jgi:hypothetical protein
MQIKVIWVWLGICFYYITVSEEKSTIGVIIYTFIFFLILIALSFKSTQKKT